MCSPAAIGNLAAIQHGKQQQSLDSRITCTQQKTDPVQLIAIHIAAQTRSPDIRIVDSSHAARTLLPRNVCSTGSGPQRIGFGKVGPVLES
jgi:hypothetical protein